MRLIDADELKEVIFSKTNGMEDLWDTAGVLNAINKALTVEAIPTELHERILNETTGELLECQSNLRPQGEWISNNTDDNSFINRGRHCSICHYTVEFSENFCPNCGADMRGEENEIR